MGLNLIWYKSYDTKPKTQETHTLANSHKFESDKWPFYDRFWPFFAKCKNIFHKTDGHFEVLTKSNLIDIKIKWKYLLFVP